MFVFPLDGRFSRIQSVSRGFFVLVILYRTISDLQTQGSFKCATSVLGVTTTINTHPGNLSCIQYSYLGITYFNYGNIFLSIYVLERERERRGVVHSYGALLTVDVWSFFRKRSWMALPWDYLKGLRSR